MCRGFLQFHLDSIWYGVIALTLRQIEFFLAVCREGSITRAADAVHVSAPPLSRALAQLEDELGVELFFRGKKGMELTVAGKIFLSGAQKVAADMGEMRAALYAHKVGRVNTIHIGSINAISSRILPFRISRFKKTHPHTSVVVHEESSPQLARRLEQRELDICIIREPIELSKTDYEMAPLYDEALKEVGMDQDYFFAIGKASFFSGIRGAEKEVPVAALKGIPIVIHNRYVPMLISQCAKFNFAPDIVFENKEVTSLISWAHAGLGVAIVPYTSTLLLGCETLSKRKIVQPEIASQAYVVWGRQNVPSDEVMDMIDLLRHPQ